MGRSLGLRSTILEKGGSDHGKPQLGWTLDRSSSDPVKEACCLKTGTRQERAKIPSCFGSAAVGTKQEGKNSLLFWVSSRRIVLGQLVVAFLNGLKD